MNKIRVWLAGNLKSFRPNCHLSLANCPALECVGESDLSWRALCQIEAARPDVIILDIDSHDRRTNRILRHLASSIPTARIIAHSPASNKRFVMRLLCLGVKGYVSGKEIVKQLPEAIEAVMQGGVFLCPTASGALVNEYRKRAQSRKRIHATSSKSSPAPA